MAGRARYQRLMCRAFVPLGTSFLDSFGEMAISGVFTSMKLDRSVRGSGAMTMATSNSLKETRRPCACNLAAASCAVGLGERPALWISSVCSFLVFLFFSASYMRYFQILRVLSSFLLATETPMLQPFSHRRERSRDNTCWRP